VSRSTKLARAVQENTVVVELVTVVSWSAGCLITGGLVGFLLGRLTAGSEDHDHEPVDDEE